MPRTCNREQSLFPRDYKWLPVRCVFIRGRERSRSRVRSHIALGLGCRPDFCWTIGESSAKSEWAEGRLETYKLGHACLADPLLVNGPLVELVRQVVSEERAMGAV